MIDPRTRLKHISGFALFFLIGYSIVARLPHYAVINGTTAWDRAIPFIPAFIIFYIAGYLYLLLPMLLEQDEMRFKRMMRSFFVMMAIGYACFILLPIDFPKEVVLDDGIFSAATAAQYSVDTTFNNFPSLHVASAVIAWLFLLRINRKVAYWTTPLMIGIVISVVFVKQHLIIDIFGGIALAVGVWWFTEKAQRGSPAR